jgi:putative ABC transport system permease protein
MMFIVLTLALSLVALAAALLLFWKWRYGSEVRKQFSAVFLPVVLFWDKSKRSLVLAFRSLWLHKLRAFLSVLGIIIGTAAVIALTGFGEGSMQDALDDIARQGATNIIVRSVKPVEESASQQRSRVLAYGLNFDDYKRLQTLRSVEFMVPMRIFPQQIRRLQYLVPNGRVVATTADYQYVNKFEMALGRFLQEDDPGDGDEDEGTEGDDRALGDDRAMRNVCVLGSEIAERLFPFEHPLGKSIVINRMHYRVVGVVSERMPTGGTGGSQAAEEFNNDVYIPIRTSFGRIGERVFFRASGAFSAEEVKLSQVTLKITEMSKVKGVGKAIRDQLEQNHLKKDWAVTIPLDRLEEAERARDRYTMLLVVIASISLFVGGIGIMNIMLATVTERTREIGIRRALGAKRRDITLQFIIEAVAQTSLGGLMGVLLGLGIVFLIPFLALKFFDSNLPAKVNVFWVFMSLFVAIAVGVAFGWYPAWKASRLDPIEALRHE